MSDLNPTTIFFILSETAGLWLWLLVVLAFAALAAIVMGIIKLRRASRPAKHPSIAAIAAGLLITTAFTFLVPIWTLAYPSALSAPVDYAFAILFALIPGSVVSAIAFFLLASKSAATTPRAFRKV